MTGVSLPWPPQLDDLKAELRLDRSDTRDDERLQVVLDGAVAHVESQREGDFNFTGATTGDDAALPAPGHDFHLGTIRLAVRWHTLRRSPDGLVDGGELGSVRVPRIPADIERLLGIGAYRCPLVG